MLFRPRTCWIALAAVALAAAITGVPEVTAVPASAAPSGIDRAALPANAIRHVIVIDLENESFSSTFGPGLGPG